MINKNAVQYLTLKKDGVRKKALIAIYNLLVMLLTEMINSPIGTATITTNGRVIMNKFNALNGG
jgi:hypothetical protein